MIKKFTNYIIIFSILFVLYNVLVFAIPYPKHDLTTFFVAYIYTMISFLAQPLICFVALYKSKSFKNKLYAWPIIRTGFIYIIVQVIISVIIYILGAFISIPVWIIFVVSTIILGIAVIYIIVGLTYKEEIEKIEEHQTVNTKFVLELKIESDSLLREVKEEELHKKLEKFNELVKYSDPVSSEQLSNIENQIKIYFEEIVLLVHNSNYEQASSMLDTVYQLMEERNKKCKLYKNN